MASLMKIVYLLTHGDKLPGANPGLSPKGKEEIARVRAAHPPDDRCKMVVCGTGRRHHETAEAYGVTPNRWTEAVGGPESLEKIGGERVIVLADGTVVPDKSYTGVADATEGAKSLIRSLPAGSLIVAGRPLAIMLDHPDAKSGALYQFVVNEEKIEFCLILFEQP